jgi:hypothetical protein
MHGFRRSPKCPVQGISCEYRKHPRRYIEDMLIKDTFSYLYPSTHFHTFANASL